jgi:glycosyltransferase involved in cell wall biosynthesis
MRIAVVSSYLPRHCGIGSYARPQVEGLRKHGHDVTLISPPDGDGDIKVPFSDGRVFREVARRGSAFERIVVHFQPGLYYTPGATAAVSKIRTSMALLSLVKRRPQVEILVHEAHPPTRWRPDHLILRRAFAKAHLLFHTDAERRALERDYRIGVRARLVDHRDGVRVQVAESKEEARRRLGLDPAEPLFLCAGFIHPWKGYDRAIRAFAATEGRGRLAIVGSVRDETAENLAYAGTLRTLTAATEGVTLVEAFQSDEEFDTWMTAADRVVLPYTRAWSSGALARARVLGTPAIVSAVGCLAEQAGPDDIVVRSAEELRAAFQRVRGTAGAGSTPADRDAPSLNPGASG